MDEKAAEAVAQNTAPKRPEGEEEFSQLTEKRSFGLAILINWITAILAIGATAFFWMIWKDSLSKIDSMQTEKQSILAEITSPTYISIEKEASAFKSAVTELQAVQASRYSANDFLTKLYAEVDQKVKISNITFTKEGKLTISGTSDSYHSVAGQLLTFQNWVVNDKHILRNVDLNSVSETIAKDGTAQVPFSISATINKTADLTPVAVPTDSSASTGTTGTSIIVPSPTAGGL